MITLEALRYMHKKTLWDVAQALHKDAQETLALLQGNRHFTLTPDEVMTLARCLEVPFEEAVAAANMSYAINHYRLLVPPLEETLEFRWHQEQQAGQHSYKQQTASFNQPGVPSHIQHAFTLLDLNLDATTEQIRQAFRERVKRAADGKGGYRTDMDKLVQAKELALAFQQGQQR
jgi:tRNA C32,U32 (ribose-2'-O)-methylase TrmJ